MKGKEQQENFSKVKELQTITGSTIINVLVPGELHLFKNFCPALAEAEIAIDSIHFIPPLSGMNMTSNYVPAGYC